MTEPPPADARCGGRTGDGRKCRFRGRIAVDGSLLCMRHAAAVARKAAEDAEEAAYWEKMFTPRPGQPYRADPEWQAAKREHLADIPGENDNDELFRRISAAYRLRDIEARWKASAAPAATPRS